MSQLTATHNNTSPLDDWDQGSSDVIHDESRDFNQPMVVWRWIRDQCQWPSREKLAYWCLYSRRGRDGRPARAGIRRIAKDMGCAKNTAAQAIKTLEQLGALTVERAQYSDQGDPDPNLYHLVPPWEAKQTLPSTPRGVHARKLTQVGQNLTQGLNLGEGRSGTDTEVGQSLTQGRVRNCDKTSSINEQLERAERTSVASAPKRSRNRQLSQDALDLAKALYDWLKENNALPGDNGFFTKQAGIAENALLPVRSKDEWLACLEWAKTEPYWSTHLSSLRQLGQSVWPQYARRNQGPQRPKKTSPFAQGPRFDDPNSIFFRGGSAK